MSMYTIHCSDVSTIVFADAGVYMNKPGGTVEEESSSKTQSCSRSKRHASSMHFWTIILFINILYNRK